MVERVSIVHHTVAGPTLTAGPVLHHCWLSESNQFLCALLFMVGNYLLMPYANFCCAHKRLNTVSLNPALQEKPMHCFTIYTF